MIDSCGKNEFNLLVFHFIFQKMITVGRMNSTTYMYIHSVFQKIPFEKERERGNELYRTNSNMSGDRPLRLLRTRASFWNVKERFRDLPDCANEKNSGTVLLLLHARMKPKCYAAKALTSKLPHFAFRKPFGFRDCHLHVSSHISLSVFLVLQFNS